MAISRTKKETLVAEYKEQLANASALVFTNYAGVKVANLQSLRAKLQSTDSQFAVVKNTLLRIAMAESGYPDAEQLLTGPNAVAFIGEDVGRGVTALQEWIRDAKMVAITGAVMEKSVLNASQAEALATLPTKEQTLAMILGTINAPSSALVRTIAAPAASLARVINARADQLREQAA